MIHRGFSILRKASVLLLMIQILHYFKDSKLWGIMVDSLLWVTQALYHQPYAGKVSVKKTYRAECIGAWVLGCKVA